jgi:NADH dehydrogenase [ubiquinone] 1 alpha subcomplex assembly factor 7
MLRFFARSAIQKVPRRCYTEIPILTDDKQKSRIAAKAKREVLDRDPTMTPRQMDFDHLPVNIENIIKEIKLAGPMTLAHYITRCNKGSNTEGYTMNRDPLGVDGDFVTSPEISQMFGELVGAWACHEFLCSNFAADKTVPIRIVELGPGRGTMMKDILRVTQQLRKYIGEDRKIEVSMVEISEILAGKQKESLQEFFSDTISVNWYNKIDDVPTDQGVPEYIFCHEFFDALPIQKFRTGENQNDLHEVMVDYDPKHSRKLRFVVAPTVTTKLPKTAFIKSFLKMDPTSLQNRGFNEFEVCIDAATIMSQISHRIVETQGAGLIIDYGFLADEKVTDDNKGKIDTFRGYRKHHQVDVLEFPGETDLTADVDFDFLAKALLYDNKLMEGVRLAGPITQRTWLKNMGIDQRLKNLLAENKDSENRKKLVRGYEYMTDNEKMGSRFKVMAVVPKERAEYSDQLPVTGFHIQDHEKEEGFDENGCGYK